MKIEFDPAKNERNIRERGLSFEQVREFDFDTALIRIDLRRNYGEPRFIAFGMIGTRVYNLVFTIRVDTIRVISFRKANRREAYRYANHQDT
jgi:uncharacterized DUF497 family protein